MFEKLNDLVGFGGEGFEKMRLWRSDGSGK